MKNSIVKIVLGVVATGSFAIAFGQEKISQLIPFTQGSSNNSECLNQFYRDEPPILTKDSLKKNSYPLCFNGFNVMYSGVSKTPLWTAEYLSPSRLSQKIKREDNFHEEERVSSNHRALLSDYRGSGYDRGHMSPNADMSNTASQFDSFSLANMVPQAPKNNQQVWRELEEATRAMVTKQKKDVYVVTGPVFSGKKLKTIGNGVIVPTAVFKAIYIPKHGIIGAYYAPNDNSLKVKVVSVCYLEEQLGINLFPQLTEEQKRNTYKLPLTANQVKANKDIEYAHWDAESQCAETVPTAQIKALQKQFQPDGKGNASSSTTGLQIPEVDEETKDALVKQLVEALLQYILQFLK
ncbi:DNA/RNA non-specific endonuclease [Acinetobacter sp. WCHAc060033]|uniref:DNA/RNA non-specific endonuclease n=1 Tax=Acinetobacter sp. WCHAc060033 TaxID=2518624 RepID=UPI0010239A08|nr:DNA/RNA non-specific endonuclease [Acinetobacter sp. WCHAc060033]RZG86545.1 DNA/RNA non-specific endonuclease [Acinetobacter sp. WCHAc060033]